MNQSDAFLELITECQGRLYAFIVASLCDSDAANEVLQETNLVMWRRSGEFEIGSNFKAWSYRIASFQIMAYRQRRLREKLLFDHELVEQIAEQAQLRSDQYDARMKRLDRCIEKLPPRSRDVVGRRYCDGQSLQKIADDLNQTRNAIGQLFFRIKKRLIECVSQGGEEVGIDAV